MRLAWLRRQRPAAARRSEGSIAASVSRKRIRALETVVVAFFIMCVFEGTKYEFFPKIDIWASHSATIVFVTLMVGAISVFVIRKEESLRLEMASSEMRYRLLFGGSLTGAYRITLDGRILDCNVAFCQMFGCVSREEVIGQSAILGYFDEADRIQFIDRLKTEKELTNFEQRLRRKDGSAVWILISAALVDDETEGCLVVQGTMTDITDRVDAQQNSRLLADIVRCSHDAIFSITTEGLIQTWNVSAERIFGYRAVEIVGSSVRVLTPDDEVTERDEILETVSNGREVKNRESVCVSKDGRRIAVEITISPTTDTVGTVIGASIVARDITEKRRRELALRQSEQQYRFLFESNPVPMWVFARNTLRFLAVNSAAIEQYGYSEQEFMTMKIMDIRPQEEVTRLLENAAICAGGLQKRGVWKHRRKDGSMIDAEIVSHRLDFQGIDSILVAAHDITDRKRADESVRQAEEKYRAIFENSVVGIFQGTPDGRLTSANRAFAEMLGYDSPEQMLAENPGRASSTLVNPGQMAVWFQEMAEHGVVRGVEFEMYRKDRTTKWVRGSLRALRDASGNIVLHEGTVEDITERKRAEGLLQDSENKYRVLFEDSGEAIWLNDENGVLNGNSAALQMFGYSVGDAMPHPSLMSPPMQPDGTPSEIGARQRIAAAAAHGKERFEWLHQRKNGEVFASDVCLTALTLSGRPVTLATVRDITERKRAEEALLFKTALLEAQTETTIDGVLVVDESDHIVLINKQFGIDFGIPKELLSTRDDIILRKFTMDMVENPDAFLERIKYLNGNRDEKSRDELRLKNGKIFDRYSAPLVDAKGQYRGRIWYHRDITDRKAAEEALLFKTALLEGQTEATIDGILVVDESDRIVLANKQFGLIFGLPDELLGTRNDRIVRKYVTDQVKSADAFIEKVQYLYSHQEEKSRDEIDLKNGNVLDRYSAPLVDSNGRYRGRIWYFRDITDRKVAEKRIQFLAYHDALTGLPHRVLLQDRLDHALADARRRNEKVALLFLDLDRFKAINDSFGHSLGDLALKVVAERLKDCAREQDTVARVGGDEFLILLNGVKDAADVAIAAERILDAMKASFTIQDHSLNVGCSIGVSMFPDHGADGETLIKNADAAMYFAKENGLGTVRFFTDEMNVEALERLTMDKDLRVALDREEFFLMYQPQMDIESGRITGFEALIRWQHPEKGLVMPDKFISIAENDGLILPIGEWVLRTACAEARKWQDDGLPAVVVAVNVSAVQFRQEGFCALIRKVLVETGLRAEYLELEVTESLLLSNADVTLSVLRELKEMGLKLAIDDFGTGYSSFSYLKQFSIDKLKIDQCFVRDVAVSSNDAAIANAIISMAKSLNLKVIAEGVENEPQMAFLRENRCDEIQGYYLSKPISADDAALMLQGAPYQSLAARVIALPDSTAVLVC